MITKLKTTIWAMALLFSVASVMVLSSCGEEDEPDPDPAIAPTLSYAANDVALGSSVDDWIPAVQGDLPIAYTLTDAGDAADFVSVDAVTGAITVAAESVIGTYDIVVKATNLGGSSEATASLTISISPDFDPTGMNLHWKYVMNNSADITLLNLDLLSPGAPNPLDLPTGWPDGWPVINPADPTLQAYLALTGVQEALMQVPGDDACGALEPKENGDTLLIIVNDDLTLSTICHVDKTQGTTVDIGTSAISYANDGFVWTIDVALQGIPVTIAINGAEIVDSFADPLHPHYSSPSGVGGAYKAITGNVPQYMTPTDFNPDNYITSIQFLDVDVVLEVME